ncbi:Cytochrome b-c1 complex subunit 7 protein [Dioscorea alata]|uniref:Cytochrome b-c1 complex subunit 7 protein n=1 Tax=Dioscorea alata TaxID=55571 RepID=A0ACB7UXB9_DIOAL|nr:Cytochrome b-c1 complex subunit 7 protein [Dioscorea alata]
MARSNHFFLDRPTNCSSKYQAHKEAAGLYGKSFPSYNELAPVFTKDRAFGSSACDIRDDMSQYENEVNIILEEDASLSQMPMDDFFMHTQEPSQEPTESPSPIPSDSSASKTSRRQKRKSLTADPTMKQISSNFRSFVGMVGLEFKALANAKTAKLNLLLAMLRLHPAIKQLVQKLKTRRNYKVKYFSRLMDLSMMKHYLCYKSWQKMKINSKFFGIFQTTRSYILVEYS